MSESEYIVNHVKIRIIEIPFSEVINEVIEYYYIIGYKQALSIHNIEEEKYFYCLNPSNKGYLNINNKLAKINATILAKYNISKDTAMIQFNNTKKIVEIIIR